MRAQQLTIMTGGLAVAIYLFIPIVLLSVRTVIWLRSGLTSRRGSDRCSLRSSFVAAVVGWPLFIRAWFSILERIHAAIVDRRRWRNDREYRSNEIQPAANPAPYERDNSMDKGIPITKTGLVSRLGFYAERGELFLTTQITGTDADRIREEIPLAVDDRYSNVQF